MKKVFLYAYDHQNLGDDLFVETILKRYPEVKFYLWSDKKNEQVFSECSNLKIINKDSKKVKLLEKVRPSFAARYKAGFMNMCDAHVYIGGSIFMEYPSWENIVRWWDYQASNYKFYVMGANFGPYQTKEYKNRMTEVFFKLKDVCFRDYYSKNLFPDVPTVRCAPDILFSYPMDGKAVEKKQVFFSVISYGKKEMSRDFHQMTHREYIQRMARMAEGYLAAGFQVVLASFCEEEGDLEAAEEIAEEINKEEEYEKVKILSYDGKNRRQFMREMMQSEHIVAARFHGTILGMTAGRTVFPILYSDKTKYVLEDAGFQGTYGDLRKPDTLTYENSKRNYDEKYRTDVGKLKRDAQRHFEKLDEFLK